MAQTAFMESLLHLGSCLQHTQLETRYRKLKFKKVSWKYFSRTEHFESALFPTSEGRIRNSFFVS